MLTKDTKLNDILTQYPWILDEAVKTVSVDFAGIEGCFQSRKLLIRQIRSTCSSLIFI